MGCQEKPRHGSTPNFLGNSSGGTFTNRWQIATGPFWRCWMIKTPSFMSMAGGVTKCFPSCLMSLGCQHYGRIFGRSLELAIRLLVKLNLNVLFTRRSLSQSLNWNLTFQKIKNGGGRCAAGGSTSNLHSVQLRTPPPLKYTMPEEFTISKFMPTF